MGTRGCWGFRLDGKDYLTYNQMDSYPTGLGQTIADFINHTSIRDTDGFDGLKAKVSELKLVDAHSKKKPTKAEQAYLAQYADTQVDDGRLDNWYVLLRGCQGDPVKTLKSGYMVDSHGFMSDSLFCEWAYIVNLDDMVLEVYRGFQRKPHDKGRYACNKASDGYYPVALVRTDALDKLTKHYGEIVEAEVKYGKYATLARVIEKSIEAALLPFDFGLRFYGGIEEYDRGGGEKGRKIVFYANIPDND